MVNSWLSAFRLRTLPLALSSIITGSAIAYYHFNFNVQIFILALLTTLFLQILSNLANDYGDGLSGVDNEHRVGPQRSIQSGKISIKKMKIAILIFVLLSLSSGIPLVLLGTKSIGLPYLIGFLTLGILAIVAAIKYTAGKNPYGYKGWGDVFVFLFFGIIGVVGSFFLHSQNLQLDVVLPAMAMGCFSTAVLNLNNLRDIINDKACGKITLAVKLGWKKGKVYQFLLILTGIISLNLWCSLNFFSFENFALIALPQLLFVLHLFKVYRASEPKLLDVALKKVALSTFMLSLLFFLSIYISF